MKSNDYRRTDSVTPYRYGQARLICQTQRRLPIAKQVDMGEMLEDMKRRGVMEESYSTWSSTVIPVWQKNWDLRFCVDNSPLKHSERHGGPSGGYMSVSKTQNKVWERYYWLQARKDVQKCQQCDTCAASRSSRTRTRGHLHQYVGAPFERIAIDVAGPFPQSDQGNRYLLIAIWITLPSGRKPTPFSIKRL
jgi:hypothetical protein